MPVYGTVAARFNDDGVTALYLGLLDCLREKTNIECESKHSHPVGNCSTHAGAIVPPDRVRYLAEIAGTLHDYHAWVDRQADVAERLWQLDGVLTSLSDDAARPTIESDRGRLRELLDYRPAAA